jgi:ATP-dependent RNA helicase DeaD
MENTNLINTDFAALGISEDILRALDDMGFEEATKIQAGSIPLLLEGKDIIGYSQTGTGKTAAFGIPALETIDRNARGKNPQVLVLCPTRELAMQACEEMNRFAKYRRTRIVAIYGGQAIERQFRLLDYGAHVVIGTPGRVMDHMRRKTLKLHEIKMVVLDEADEMLNMGFREDVETILESVPKERQTALFSATMPPAIVAITHRYQNNPEMIKVVRQQLTVPSIEQFYYEVPFGGKAEAMCRLLESHTPKRSMVFCNTKRQVDELVSELQTRGYLAAGLHGDMRQTARTQVMNSFKRGGVAILVATDVAARGIDVDDVEAVFNYDIPTDVEYYVHRIGRTGRAGKNGRAFTLTVGRKQMYELRNIQNFTKARIVRQPLPSGRDIAANRERQLFEDVRSELNSPTLLEDARMVDQLMQEGFTSVEVACALMNMVSASRQKTRQPLQYEFSYEQGSLGQAGPLGRQGPYRGDRGQGPKKIASDPVTMWRGPKGMGPKGREERDMVRLALNVGSSHKVSAGHIVGAIAGETGLPGKSIGKIFVTEKKSFVDVPRQHAGLVLSSMKNCKIRGIKTQICQADLSFAVDG